MVAPFRFSGEVPLYCMSAPHREKTCLGQKVWMMRIGCRKRTLQPRSSLSMGALIVLAERKVVATRILSLIFTSGMGERKWLVRWKFCDDDTDAMAFGTLSYMQLQSSELEGVPPRRFWARRISGNDGVPLATEL